MPTTVALRIWQIAVVAASALVGHPCISSEASPAPASVGLVVQGRQVSPLLVREFEPWISDERPPSTVTVNLSAAHDSNEYFGDVSVRDDGALVAALADGGSYGYKRLGGTGTDVHVLRTFDSGGGSGEFQALLWVRITTDAAYLADGISRGEQVFLTVLRRFPLGDRDDADVVVTPDRVVVGRSRHRTEPVVLTLPPMPPGGLTHGNVKEK